MTITSALAFYPVWALAFVLGLVALRLARSRGVGLSMLCFTQGVWVTGLLMFVTPETAHIAERVLPSGILQAAGFVHASLDLAEERRRGVLIASYTAAAACAAVGALAPRLLYAEGARGPGPLFLPLSIVFATATVVMVLWIAHRALRSTGGIRARFVALLLGAILGALGGGVTIGLFVLGVGSVWIAAPFMLGSTLLAGYAILGREDARGRRLVKSGLVYAWMTAAISSFAAAGYALLLPHIVPSSGSLVVFVAWAVVVTFFVALPLDPLRQLVVEWLGRRITRDPIGVRDLAEAVERSEVRADQAERLAELGTIVGAVAHEIRNPLGVMLAHAKILEKRGADPKTVDALRAQIDRARCFVDDLLRYGKPRPLDIVSAAVFDEVRRAALQARSAFGDGAADVDVEGDAQVYADVDRSALADVVTSLVGNALIALEGRTGRVRVTVSREQSDAIVTIEDDGPGVPEEILPRLFEPFVTGRGRDAKHPGTGLGLAIASRWIARHGGRLSHERPRGGGARFVVRLPLEARVVQDSSGSQ